MRSVRSSTAPLRRGSPTDLRHLAIYAMLGAVMFASKLLLELLPNIHLLGMLVMVFTLVYRKYALIPIYVYVLLNGIFAGFAPWWIPYLYLWAVLWGVTMLLPKTMKPAIAAPVYMLVCAFHGLFFGTLYAPAQALLFGMSFKATLAWIVAGLPFDALHAVGNLVAATLILPLITLLRRMEAQMPK